VKSKGIRREKKIVGEDEHMKYLQAHRFHSSHCYLAQIFVAFKQEGISPSIAAEYRHVPRPLLGSDHFHRG